MKTDNDPASPPEYVCFISSVPRARAARFLAALGGALIVVLTGSAAIAEKDIIRPLVQTYLGLDLTRIPFGTVIATNVPVDIEPGQTSVWAGAGVLQWISAKDALPSLKLPEKTRIGLANGRLEGILISKVTWSSAVSEKPEQPGDVLPRENSERTASLAFIKALRGLELRDRKLPDAHVIKIRDRDYQARVEGFCSLETLGILVVDIRRNAQGASGAKAAVPPRAASSFGKQR